MEAQAKVLPRSSPIDLFVERRDILESRTFQRVKQLARIQDMNQPGFQEKIYELDGDLRRQRKKATKAVLLVESPGKSKDDQEDLHDRMLEQVIKSEDYIDNLLD